MVRSNLEGVSEIKSQDSSRCEYGKYIYLRKAECDALLKKKKKKKKERAVKVSRCELRDEL